MDGLIALDQFGITHATIKMASQTLVTPAFDPDQCSWSDKRLCLLGQ